MEVYKKFTSDKGYIVNQEGNIIKVYDGVLVAPVDSDNADNQSQKSSSVEKEGEGKEPDNSSENQKEEASNSSDERREADDRRDKRNKKNPFLKAERQVEGGFKSALLVIRPINEDSHLTTEDLRRDDPICGVWMINTTTPFYHQLLLSLTNERRIFVVVMELDEAQDFYHWRDGGLLARREENPPFTRRVDCEQPRRLNVEMTKILMGYSNCSYQGERKRKRLSRTASEEHLLRYTDTRVSFTFKADERIGTETFTFSGFHQNFQSAWLEAVTHMRYMFQGNFLSPDGKQMWLQWFDGCSLSRRDVSVEHDTPLHTDVTIENDAFILVDESRNGGLRLNVTLNESAYKNMLPGRDLQRPENIAPSLSQSSTTIEDSGVQPATSSEVSGDKKNGKEVE
jgi:hypothetical protein